MLSLARSLATQSGCNIHIGSRSTHSPRNRFLDAGIAVSRARLFHDGQAAGGSSRMLGAVVFDISVIFGPSAAPS